MDSNREPPETVPVVVPLVVVVVIGTGQSTINNDTSSVLKFAVANRIPSGEKDTERGRTPPLGKA